MCTSREGLTRRLITTGVTGDTIRLVRTEKMTPETRYATLSHCWGDKLPLRTTSDNEALLANEISPDIMPRTFQDAIEVARGLGIPYLWIDALCIRQDDLVEWSHEAANMKNVYAGSILTIAASNGTSSVDGCFAPTRPGDSYRDIHFTMDDARPLHLSSRGWVLQEQLLSRRIVYCMLPELHWQCHCCYQTEAGVVFDAQENNPLPLLKERPGSGLHDIWYQWIAIKDGVQAYHTKLLDWNVSWSGTPLVSKITTAQFHLEGPMQEIVLSVAPEALDFNPPYLNVGDEVANFAERPIPWRCAGSIDRGYSDKKQGFMCLLVSSKERKNGAAPETFLHETVLLLKPVCTNDPKTATYRRVGIANFRGFKRQFVDRTPRSIILI
ncbi:hypothetical protein LQW54_001538 [Pestalotiopsis sp. IQ-011]